MSLRPIQDRVLLEKLDVFMPGSGLLALPADAKERPVVRCRVLAVGPGKLVNGRLVEPRVKAGDVVLFNQYDQSTLEVEVDGQKRLMVREGDLLVVEDGA